MKKIRKYIYSFLTFAIITIIFISPNIDPLKIFAQIVTSPIPNSVSNIKVNCYKDRRNNQRYILQFSIDEKDLMKIVSIRQFQEVGYFVYDNDYIFLGDIIGDKENVVYMIDLYERRPPKWFKLETWHKVKVYATVDDTISFSWSQLLGQPPFYEIYR